MVSVDLSGIVDKYEEDSPSNIDPKVKKEHQRRVNLNTFHHWTQFGGQPTCAHEELRRTSRGMKGPLQHPRDEELVEQFWVYRKFSMRKMQGSDVLLNHINKVKTLADRFICCEGKDVEMTLLERLPPLYEYLITILEMMPMKEFTM